MKFKNIILSYLGQFLLTFLFRTNRWKVDGAEHILKSRKSGRPTLFVTWHGQVGYGSFWIYKTGLHPWTVASRHGDGDIMARIVKRWGYKLIRGSSRRGGKEVIRKMSKIFQSDDNFVALTSDGPKGPFHVAKPGSVALARKYDADIIAITGTSNRYWEFNSWDRFRLPKPFGTVKITIAPPLEISDDQLTPEEDSQLVTEYINENFQNGEIID